MVIAGSKPTEEEVTLDKMLREIAALETIFEGWEEHEQNAVLALKKAIDCLHKEALTRLIRVLKTSPEAVEALKEALSDEVVYSVFRHHELIRPSLNERIEAALESVRPMLQGHGGNVELVSIEAPSTAIVRFIGACDGCPASELTFSAGVEKAIKEYCPEITNIVKAKGICHSSSQAVNFISPFARDREQNWIYVTELESIPEGNFVVHEVSGESVLLTRVDDKVMCYQNACAHLGMPLDMGTVVDNRLTCPHHGFEYALDSGECLTVPEVQLQTHAVRVTGSRVEVSLT